MYKVGVWNISPYMSIIFEFFFHYLCVNLTFFYQNEELGKQKWGNGKGKREIQEGKDEMDIKGEESLGGKCEGK